MRILFMGTPDFAAVSLLRLAKEGADLIGAVTAPDKPRGRHGTPVPSEVAAAAEEAGIPVFKTARVRSEESMDWIRLAKPDAVVVAAFGQILPAELLQLPRFGCINVHASLLPAWRGAAPIQHSILAGDTETGVTIMQMNEGLDTGDILAQRRVPIGASDTAGTLFDRLAAEGAALLCETLPRIEAGQIVPVPQPEESTTPYAGMLRKEDGKLDFSKSADELDRRVRAFSPWPGAFTYLGDTRIAIREVQPVNDRTDDEPGRIRVTGEDLFVQTGEGSLRILSLQPAGKRCMQTAEYLRGAKDLNGRCFV